jgi:hypothetical protein
MKKTVWLWVFIVSAACAGPSAPDHASLPGWGNYSVQLPEAWDELDFPEGTLLTRNGAFSQYILVQQRPLDKPFKITGRVLTRDMEPREAAEVLMHEMEADPGVIGFRLIEYAQVAISGQNAFQMVFRYRTKAGIPFETHCYGLLHGDWFYNLRYNADEIRSAPEDLETFLRMVKSFRITSQGMR